MSFPILQPSVFQEIVNIPIRASKEALWFAVRLWISRPHVVNRRLCGFEVIETCSFDEIIVEDDVEPPSWRKDLSTIVSHLGLELDGENRHYSVEVRNLIPRGTAYCGAVETVLKEEKLRIAIFIPIDPRNDILPEKTTSLPGQTQNSHMEFISGLDDTSPTKRRDDAPSTHNPVHRSCTAECTYRILVSENPETRLRIEIAEIPGSSVKSSTIEWLRSTLAPKLKSWAENVKDGDENASTDSTSLTLLPVKRYNEIFLRLKEKYGKALVAEWMETTDPHKFVSEDLGIAAYLLALWEKERQETGCGLQSFVDLGCGNGLLVHLLACEGHEGIGIDVRRRKIWETFGNRTFLEERTFNPSIETLPQYDWIIGNHSDELTPWVPYVSARSSYDSRFFLLPCCAFDFNHKFNKPANESEYQAYFKYLRHICYELGFVVQEDILRIPSTKRKCFIGMQRTYARQDHEERDKSRVAFLQSRLSADRGDFVVKPACEPIRNCTNLSQSLKDDIIRVTVETLLKTENFLQTPTGTLWNAGGSVSLGSLIGVMDPEVVIQMKNHCGGLQTFIRNHQHIFCVTNGEIRLRNYAKDERKVVRPKKRRPAKQRPCWFHHNHPQGCPLGQGSCFYLHNDDNISV